MWLPGVGIPVKTITPSGEWWGVMGEEAPWASGVKLESQKLGAPSLFCRPTQIVMIRHPLRAWCEVVALVSEGLCLSCNFSTP